jgi:hypothetical protein
MPTLPLLPALLALALLALPVRADVHDCVFPASTPNGLPCEHPLALDQTCRGKLNATTRDAYLDMDCDYVIYDVKAPQPTHKYIMIHSGRCDIWTAELGDWVSEATGSNLVGLRTCMGLDFAVCTLKHSECDMLHVSWAQPQTPDSFMVGWNPPAAIEAAADPKNQLVFLHEYDGYSDGYWWSFNCNKTQPSYVCITGDDPSFDDKFYGKGGSPGDVRPDGFKAKMEKLSNAAPFPCALEVVDARNSSGVPGFVIDTWPDMVQKNRFPDVPCSGMFPDITVGNWQVEQAGVLTQALQTAHVLNASEPGRYAQFLSDYLDAIEVLMANE